MAGRSRVNREVHARICEGLGVKLPRATRLDQRLLNIQKPAILICYLKFSQAADHSKICQDLKITLNTSQAHF